MCYSNTFHRALSTLAEYHAFNALDFVLEQAEAIHDELPQPWHLGPEHIWFDTLFSSPTHSVCVLARDGTVLNANPTFLRRNDQELRALVGGSVYDLFAAEDVPRRKRLFEFAHDTATILSFQDRATRKGGQLYDCSLYPVMGSGGCVRCLVLVARPAREFVRLDVATHTWEQVE